MLTYCRCHVLKHKVDYFNTVFSSSCPLLLCIAVSCVAITFVAARLSINQLFMLSECFNSTITEYMCTFFTLFLHVTLLFIDRDCLPLIRAASHIVIDIK